MVADVPAGINTAQQQLETATCYRSILSYLFLPHLTFTFTFTLLFRPKTLTRQRTAKTSFLESGVSKTKQDVVSVIIIIILDALCRPVESSVVVGVVITVIIVTTLTPLAVTLRHHHVFSVVAFIMLIVTLSLSISLSFSHSLPCKAQMFSFLIRAVNHEIQCELAEGFS